MLPDDIRSKLKIMRENIDRSRWEIFGSNNIIPCMKPPDCQDFIPKIPKQFDREKQKEVFAEQCSNACDFWASFGKGRRQEMVRVGEFSPQNPSLQTTGRSLLGLGEYEERRRQLLQKKREEYHQELTQIAQAQKSLASQNSSPAKPQKVMKDCCTQTDLSLLTSGQPLLVDVQSSNAPTKSTALFDVPTTGQALPLPEVPGFGILTPRSQSPSSPDKRTMDFTLPDNFSLIGGGLSDARLRQLRHQEDLRRQIEEKQRLEAERREKEAKEEEALLRRVAEQQARLQAEYEEEERLRRQKEREKQFQTEEFLRRQEQLLLESEQLKLETRRKRMEALTTLADQQPAQPAPMLSNSLSNPLSNQLSNPLTNQLSNSISNQLSNQLSNSLSNQLSNQLSEQKLEETTMALPPETVVQEVKESKKEKKATGKERSRRTALLVSPAPAAPISILKSTSPPPRSPREAPAVRADEQLEQPSPRALIKVLEGPTLRRPPRKPVSLEDSLPIPLLRQTRTPSPCHRPRPAQGLPPVHSTRSNPNSAVVQQVQPSEAMQRLEDKWKVPAVQKNVMTKRKAGQWGDSSESHVVLTQLGSFRRQLQEEHMRMEEKIRDFERQPRMDEKICERQPVS